MRALVTGAAGFIGSHLVDRLLKDGWDVTGVDAFTEYYPRPFKARNLGLAANEPRFQLYEADLAADDIRSLLGATDVVFHLAARPGVRSSWEAGFADYLHDNVLATQRLFEALIGAPVLKVVYASSSSIYGDAEAYPTPETLTPSPISPYGMTKLSTEQLASLYGRRFGVPAVGLRLFTVYGPRQRPDMFFNLLCRCVLEDRAVEVFGDGEQSREFTYVDDVVEAFVAAAAHGVSGELYNIGGGSEVTVNETLALLETISGRDIEVLYAPTQAGDARRTAADITKARRDLGYEPRTSLADGLQREYRWLEAEARRRSASPECHGDWTPSLKSNP